MHNINFIKCIKATLQSSVSQQVGSQILILISLFHNYKQMLAYFLYDKLIVEIIELCVLQ